MRSSKIYFTHLIYRVLEEDSLHIILILSEFYAPIKLPALNKHLLNRCEEFASTVFEFRAGSMKPYRIKVTLKVTLIPSALYIISQTVTLASVKVWMDHQAMKSQIPFTVQ